jgi:hypothetical protein
MKAWRLDRFGWRLSFEDIAVQEVRPASVLVRIEASALMSYLKEYVEANCLRTIRRRGLLLGAMAWAWCTRLVEMFGILTCFQQPTTTITAKNQFGGYGYDAAGNMTSQSGATYAYDAENRLTSSSGVPRATCMMQQADGSPKRFRVLTGITFMTCKGMWSRR